MSRVDFGQLKQMRIKTILTHLESQTTARYETTES